MSPRKKRSTSSYLNGVDTRPLSDDEIIAMGYEPTEDGWKPFRRNLVPERTVNPEPEQLPLQAGVTPIQSAPSVSKPRAGRQPRKGRSPRKPSR